MGGLSNNTQGENMHKRALAVAAVILLCLAGLVIGQEKVDLSMMSRIKAEGFYNSKVLEILAYLSDVIGPRPAGSPAYMEAAEWCRDKMTEFGLKNAALEPWGELGTGWTADYFHCQVISPRFFPVIAYPKAWTAGTEGDVVGKPVLVDIKSEADFEKYRGNLKDAIVLAGPIQPIDTIFEVEAERYSDAELADIVRYEPRARFRRFNMEDFRARFALRTATDKFYTDEGVAVVIEPSEWDEHTVRVGGGDSRDGKPGRPAMVASREHYNRIVRMLEAGVDLKMSVKIAATFNEAPTGYNVIAEIPGTDPKLKDEVVIIGGHLDSWHSGTGAVDNGVGCATAMEAGRILVALGVQPRRTIRVALWDAEERGLRGSRGYVTNHYADASTMELKPDHAKFCAYFNIDNGTGRVRGIYMQENDALRPIFEAWLESFHDLGAATVTYRSTGGTDHQSFEAVGLPGFQFIQDEISYGRRNHHSNLDVYDQVVPDDVKQIAVIFAAFAYNAAMRDEKLPRKPLPAPRPDRHMMMP
jgi:carboxypeptidase Q